MIVQVRGENGVGVGLLLSRGLEGGLEPGAWASVLSWALGWGRGRRRLGQEGWGPGRGLYRPAGLEGLPRTFCGQTHSSILTSPSGSPGPGGGQARAWTRVDRVWRVMTPAIPQVSVSRCTHEGAGAGRT